MRRIRHLKSWAKPFRVQAYREHDITWHNMIFLTTRLWGIILFWEFRHFLFFFGVSHESGSQALSPGLVGPHGHCSLGPWCALPQPIHAESAYGGCGRKHWATAPRRRVWKNLGKPKACSMVICRFLGCWMKNGLLTLGCCVGNGFGPLPFNCHSSHVHRHD